MRSCLLLLAFATTTHADELRLDAKSLFESSVTSNLRLSADGKTIEVEDGVLIEDDGPAAGFSYLPNEEKLTGSTLVRKELFVADPRAKKALLLVGRGGDAITIRINGKPIETKRERTVSVYWSVFPIPVESLREGTNEIVLGGTGSVYIARAEDYAAGSRDRTEHPKRSARSTDGGKTWSVDKLGTKGDIAGEYSVRLFLERPRRGGSLTTPILDMGNLAGRPIAPAIAKPGTLQLSTDGTSGITLRVRTGPEPIENSKLWSPWATLIVNGDVPNPAGRFFQVAIDFTANDTLGSLEITADPVRPKKDWTAMLKIAAADNPPVVRSSIPFAYEPFDHPRLKQLRSDFKLDDVVKGAKDELELILRLAAWSSKRWDKMHLKDSYPPWDAIEILKPHADGKPIGGFCQQYNLVFLQACESFGIPGRAVSIGPGEYSTIARRGGHEVAELWSNQFKKWIYIDGNMAFYALDAASDTPLSLLELRERQRLDVAGKPVPATRIVNLPENTKPWTSLKEWPPFQELRLIPRSNFLQQKSPLPLNQGMRGWSWTGHHVFSDAESPASPIYSTRESRTRNWGWTLNHAHVKLEASETPGELKAYLETQTPGFETYLASFDQRKPEATAATFTWTLHSGRNRLEVRPRNIAGREGIASVIELDYP